MGWERTKDTPEVLRMENISLVTPRGKSYIIQSKPRYDYWFRLLKTELLTYPLITIDDIFQNVAQLTVLMVLL